MSDFLNMLRGRGLLSDIDVAFARFIGRNADGDPALTLLAALVSNAASVHGEIALPAEKIASCELLKRYLRNLSPSEDREQLCIREVNGIKIAGFELYRPDGRLAAGAGRVPAAFPGMPS